MKNKINWADVWSRLQELADIVELPNGSRLWRAGQEHSLQWIQKQLQDQPGVLIADEVGLGKTRLAVALAVCVVACGGRVAIMIPPGLTYQWKDEELRGFLEQIKTLNLPWIPRDISSRVLRTYPDLFGGKGAAPSYPLTNHNPILFVSHRFGLPALGTAKRHELWGLPFFLKLQLVGDGRKARGAASLDIKDNQEAAAHWLSKNMPRHLQRQLLAQDIGQVNNHLLNKKENQILFRHLIGELVGEVDLIVIDEAHKNRAGTDALGTAEKRVDSMLQSRLNACLGDILLRPGVNAANIKRVALTATPMEMDATQWSDIMYRLGLEKKQVQALDTTVKQFGAVVTALRSGSAREIANLEHAAVAFGTELSPLVTRRLWRDHPAVSAYAQLTGTTGTAHPHRRSIPHLVPLSTISAEQRLKLAFAEGLAAASKGIATSHSFKSAGSRHSQGLPLMSEAPAEIREASQAPTPSDTREEQAKRQRQAYWLRCLKNAAGESAFAAEPRFSLQWHPKISYAINLIESLSAQNKKVLVFAEFLAPIHALNRALNIRHYLRHIRENKPIPVPAGVAIDDADLVQWLKSGEMGFSDAQIAGFSEIAKDFGTRYANERASLRDACRKAAEAYFEQLRPQPSALPSETMHSLLTWLVQKLCAGDGLGNYADADGDRRLQADVKACLSDLRDNDSASTGAESDAESDFDWPSAIREQAKEELITDTSGNYLFRMSPYSQLLIGDTRPSTRRARQSTFNNPQLNPQVLIGQSAVASEGLNLHRACRDVILFHLDWNPGRIEQQIGRVDRQDSLWMNDFYNHTGDGPAPTIDIHAIALEGTYDAFRSEVVHERAKVLRAQLFGEILPLEQLTLLSEEAQAAIRKIDVDFRPPGTCQTPE